MGRIYTAVFKGTAVTAAQDLFELAAPADTAVKVHGWTLSQITEVADAEEEMLTITVNRGEGSTSGSGGASVTPAARSAGDSASGVTVERNNTTIMSAGTITELETYAWNVRVPLQMLYTPETMPIISASDRLTVELETAPGDSITMHGTLIFEELGG